ncbi:tetratricopeptide repeat protein [Planctomyces sp. SH-PL14]|uniref:tetratricopeptide repeat protein n=1 Tax=Planctomyces sp. SH-PL14 TaxID=1632864 RepID=UPI0018D2AAA7|nr:tetratricopeptide repeat protein [Planctomyces sp. SH-PL14]
MPTTELPSTFAVARRHSPNLHPLASRVWRFCMGIAGLVWIGLACSLCGCGATSSMAYNYSGRRAFKQGNYEVARRDFEQAVAANPDNADYAFNLAAAMHKQGDLPAAEQAYRRGIAADPTHQPSYHGLAKLMQDQGRTNDATQLLSAWAGSQPNSAEPQLELAALHGNTGNLTAAEQSLQRARQISPRDSRVLAHMGQIYGRQGRNPEAVAMYNQAIGLDPTQQQYQAQAAALSGSAGGNGIITASFDGQPTGQASMMSQGGEMPQGGSVPGPMNAVAAQQYQQYFDPGSLPPGGQIVSVTVDGKPVAPGTNPFAQNVSFSGGGVPTATTWSTQPMPQATSTAPTQSAGLMSVPAF